MVFRVSTWKRYVGWVFIFIYLFYYTENTSFRLEIREQKPGRPKL